MSWEDRGSAIRGQTPLSEISVEFLENSEHLAEPPIFDMYSRLALLTLLIHLPVSWVKSEGVRPFFAFQNGVRFSTHEKRAEALGELGFDGIGSASFPKDGNVSAMLEAYEARDLRVFSFYTGGSVSGEGGQPAAGLYEAIPKLKGSSVVLEIYLKGDRGKDLDEQAVAWLRELAEKASQSGLVIALYPHTSMYIETIGDAVRLAKKVDRENVGVMFNLCHFLRIEPDADLRKALTEARPYLQQVSLSGADQGGRDWKALIQPLGQGSYDVRPLIEFLDEIDFRGPVGVQCFNISGDSRVFLKQSIEAWKTLSQ